MVLGELITTGRNSENPLSPAVSAEIRYGYLSREAFQLGQKARWLEAVELLKTSLDAARTDQGIESDRWPLVPPEILLLYGLYQRMAGKSNQAGEAYRGAEAVADKYEFADPNGRTYAHIDALSGLMIMAAGGELPDRSFADAEIYKTEAKNLITALPPEHDSIALVNYYTANALLWLKKRQERIIYSRFGAKDSYDRTILDNSYSAISMCRRILDKETDNIYVRDRLARALSVAGAVELELGKPAEALEHNILAYEMYRELGDVRGRNKTAMGMGDSYKALTYTDDENRYFARVWYDIARKAALGENMESMPIDREGFNRAQQKLQSLHTDKEVNPHTIILNSLQILLNKGQHWDVLLETERLLKDQVWSESADFSMRLLFLQGKAQVVLGNYKEAEASYEMAVKGSENAAVDIRAEALINLAQFQLEQLERHRYDPTVNNYQGEFAATRSQIENLVNSNSGVEARLQCEFKLLLARHFHLDGGAVSVIRRRDDLEYAALLEAANILQQVDQSVSPEHFEILLAKYSIGWGDHFKSIGKYSEAKIAYEKAYQIYLKFGSQHQTAKACIKLAKICQWLKDPVGILSWSTEAMFAAYGYRIGPLLDRDIYMQMENVFKTNLVKVFETLMPAQQYILTSVLKKIRPDEDIITFAQSIFTNFAGTARLKT